MKFSLEDVKYNDKKKNLVVTNIMYDKKVPKNEKWINGFIIDFIEIIID